MFYKLRHMTFFNSDYSPIKCQSDISITEDLLLDLARKIFISHYGELYKQRDLSLYQTIPHKHPTIPNCIVMPHFVRDDGVIIYLQLVQNNIYLKGVTEEIINLTMEILLLEKTSVFTIKLRNNFSPNDISVNGDISELYENISEKCYNKIQRPNLNTPNNTPNNTCPDGFSKNEWVSASKTRNYALKDTLVDWLDYWYDAPNHARNQKSLSIGNEYSFSKFIMGTGINFESKIIQLIKNNVKESEFVTICDNFRNFEESVIGYEKNSIAEILKGTPIIYQPVLMNREGDLCYSYGMPDLLIRSDYLDRIVKLNPLNSTKQKYKAPNLSGNYHYVVIDIKFTTLELCADGKRIRNSGSVPAYKCQLYVYNHALAKIQGYEPNESYILGRKYKYVCKGKKYSGNNCFSRLGHIEYDNWDCQYITTTISAINWIKMLRKNGKEWKLFPKPSVPELYPNMCNQYDGHWDNFKNDYARKIGEITLLWNCGVKNRDIAHKNSIYSYWDPNCNSNSVGIKGAKQAPILNKIISINKKRKFDTAMERIDITINKEINNQWMIQDKLRLSVDFEMISNVFDDFIGLPNSQEKDYLFMIGVSYQIESNPISYKMFLIAELSEEAEFQLIYQFYCFVKKLSEDNLGTNVPIPPLYHWGNIEKSYFSKLCTRLEKILGNDVLSDINLMRNNLTWYDLLECFKKNPIVINGCFKFGLKEIAGRLSELGLIKSNWNNNNSSCAGGATAMVMAYNAYQTSKKTGIPIVRNPLIKEIMEYNKIDCVVLHEIINFLKEKLEYDDDSGEPPSKKQKK